MVTIEDFKALFGSDRLLFFVTENSVNDYAKEMIGRKLTEDELLSVSKGIDWGLGYDLDEVIKTSIDSATRYGDSTISFNIDEFSSSKTPDGVSVEMTPFTYINTEGHELTGVVKLRENADNELLSTEVVWNNASDVAAEEDILEKFFDVT